MTLALPACCVDSDLLFETESCLPFMPQRGRVQSLPRLRGEPVKRMKESPIKTADVRE
jgi:hypothetical protein